MLVPSSEEEDAPPAVPVTAEELDPGKTEDGPCWLYEVEAEAEAGLDDPPVRTEETTDETSESMDETMDEMGSRTPGLEEGADELPGATDELSPSRGSRVVVAPTLSLPLSLEEAPRFEGEDEGNSTMLDVTADGAVEMADEETSLVIDVAAEGVASADEAEDADGATDDDGELSEPTEGAGEETGSLGAEDDSSTLLDALDLSGAGADALLPLLAAAPLADVAADDASTAASDVAGCADEVASLLVLALALVLDGSASCV